MVEGPARGRRRADPAAREEARERRAAVDDVGTVLAAAARLLEDRPRTASDVRVRLTRAGYRAELVDAAVARLTALGYLDDEEFARAWIASRDRAHPRGERALRMELARKGVDREIVDAALAERAAQAATQADGQLEPEDEVTSRASGPDEAAAARVLEQRRSTLERIGDPRARRQRAYALLARSGFDPETAASVAARFMRGEPDA